MLKMLARPFAYGGFLVGMFGSWAASAYFGSVEAGLGAFFIGAFFFLLGIVFAGLPTDKSKA